MEKLYIYLENCFGIKKMVKQIDFSEKNISIIYAPNGTMKSSFAKTLEAIGNREAVEERVFGYKSKYIIKDENNHSISPESIMVINPFDRKDCENQGLLMANADLRKQYMIIHEKLDDRKKVLFEKIKVKLGYSIRSRVDIENIFLEDWNCKKNQLFECLENVCQMLNDKNMYCDLNENDINYDLLFNDNVQKLIETNGVIELIEEYEKKYTELISKSLYLHEGIIDHNNYKKISKSLYDNGFFTANNEILLKAKDGSEKLNIVSHEELDKLMQEEKERVLNTKELKEIFEKINGLIDKNKETRKINEFLQKHPEVVIEYGNIGQFKKKVWVKVFKECDIEFTGLIKEYLDAKMELEKLRNEAKKETTEWNEVLKLFKERFFVPFNIVADNQEDVILNMELPSFKYIFEDSVNSIEIVKDKLLSVLSTGEHRAYYILNMLFNITIAQKEQKEKILVLDDISESFDYKNKYAIIEYLNDISRIVDKRGNRLFKIIILTHNFDFYRTIASRLECKNNAYIAYVNNEEICFIENMYTKTVFNYLKTRIRNNKCDRYIVATIPFVRNLIEYTEGYKDKQYLKLTNLLHYKPETLSIKLIDVEEIYHEHWLKSNKVNFSKDREEELVIDIIFREAEKINDTEMVEIENKLILSMAIRLKAEMYITNKLIKDVPNAKILLKEIYENDSQTGNLIRTYKEFINDDNTKVLDQVAMLTSENIHLNSFMFEPILDMSIRHLYNLYQTIKRLDV